MKKPHYILVFLNLIFLSLLYGDLITNSNPISEELEKFFPKEYFYKENTKVSFMSLWSKINGIDSWIANPWVWVYEFKIL